MKVAVGGAVRGVSKTMTKTNRLTMRLPRDAAPAFAAAQITPPCR